MTSPKDEGDGLPALEPFAQEDAATLEAELRQALQHQRAAQQRAEETREEMRLLMERARELLNRTKRRPTSDPSAEDPA